MARLGSRQASIDEVGWLEMTNSLSAALGGSYGDRNPSLFDGPIPLNNSQVFIEMIPWDKMASENIPQWLSLLPSKVMNRSPLRREWLAQTTWFSFSIRLADASLKWELSAILFPFLSPAEIRGDRDFIGYRKVAMHQLLESLPTPIIPNIEHGQHKILLLLLCV